MTKTRLLLPMCIFAALLTAAPTALADNWTRFRGPNGTGVANDRDIPVKFNDKTNLVWKVAIPGIGNSSPVIWGKRLFVQTSTKGAKQRQLLCLDTVTGKTLWTRSIPAIKPNQKVRGDSSLASSSPAVDGERVYVAFWDGKDIILTAYDLDGKKLWDRNLGFFESQHGPGASPVVYMDKVYFANDSDGASKLYAFDSKTGKTIWAAERPYYRACYSAPFLLEKLGQKPELVVSSTMATSGYDPDTGAKLWNWTWKFTGKMPLRTTASPVYANGMLILFSGDGSGERHSVAVQLKGNGKDTVANKVWEYKKDFPYVPTPVVRGDHLYFVNDNGMVGCYQYKTGEQVWFQRLSKAKVKVYASPVLIDGKIYVISETGEVFVIAAEPKFQMLATNALEETIRATPAVADNRLYIRSDTHLYCFGKK